MNNLLALFRSFPRAARWAILAALGVAAYFAVVEPTLDASNHLRIKADLLAAGLAQERALRSADSDAGRAIADGQRLFGDPLLPSDPANSPDAIHRAINTILSKHGVTKITQTESVVPIIGDRLTALVKGRADAAADRYVVKITFDAAPETVVAILADLEASPQVAAISLCDIRRTDALRGADARAAGARTVRAVLAPESWIVRTAREDRR